METAPQEREEVTKMRESVTKKEGMRLGIQNPSRSCVRAETGLTRIPKICIHDYECWHCAFSQWLEEIEKSQARIEDFKDERDFLAEAA
jgi:hypothetical protein